MIFDPKSAMKRRLLTLAAATVLMAPPLLQAAPKVKPVPMPPAPAAPQVIVLRHALSGTTLDAFATLVLRFNGEEAKRKSGAGRIVLEDVAGIADRARLPHLALFDPDDAPAMFDTRPRFLPLHKVMAADRQAFDAKQFYPQVFDAVDDLAGRMQALPLALSLPVLFYNKEAFEKAGLDSATPPKTWWEVQEAAGKLREAGFACPLTSSRFAWVHVENVAAQHGEPLMVKDGKKKRLALNNMVNVKHMALLTSWQKSRYFDYSGPGREGDERFARGECAMLTGESALYTRLKRQTSGFAFGVAALPYYDDVYGVRPKNVLPDGAALWVLAADKKPERQIIARFIAFLLRPEVQRDWVRATGFLPMTPAATKALAEAGVDPVILAQVEARLAMPQRDAARTKFGFGKSRIRAILDEEVEFVWGDRKPPKAALDATVARAAPLLAPAAQR